MDTCRSKAAHRPHLPIRTNDILAIRRDGGMESRFGTRSRNYLDARIAHQNVHTRCVWRLGVVDIAAERICASLGNGGTVDCRSQRGLSLESLEQSRGSIAVAPVGVPVNCGCRSVPHLAIA